MSLTYEIPSAFYQYEKKRDGWKGERSILIQCGIMGLLLSAFFMQAPRLRTLTDFLLIFFGYACAFYGFRCVLLVSGSSVTFKHEGIKNPGKRPPIPYDRYEKVTIEMVSFEGASFQKITFISKPESRPKRDIEYGFYSSENISPLVAFLKQQGLPVEERIEGAPPVEMA